MEIVITQWGLDAYLDLKHKGTFSRQDYLGTIRPDVLLLKVYPNHPKFLNGKFWSIATLANQTIREGFKMKWHNLGDNAVQLRLGVGLGFPDSLSGNAFLAHAYVKTDPKFEERQLIKLETRLDLICKGRFVARGTLK